MSGSFEVDDLIENTLIWDAHAGVFPDPSVDLSLLKEWWDHSVDYVSINVGFDVLEWQRTLATLAAYRRFVLAQGDWLVLASSLADIDRAKAEGKLAVSFDIEGMNALNDNVDMVDIYHTLGVRQMLFAYNLNNQAAGGCHDNDSGLTDFGARVVERMNDLGVIVDCSHIGFQTSLDIIAASKRPVVFSHSNPSAVWMHERNINDQQIKACAATGGVVGINGMGIFLGQNDKGADAILRHVRHLADLVGPEHIGFGFDYAPHLDIDVGTILASRPDYWPPGNQYDTADIAHTGPGVFTSIVEKLLNDGFSEQDIRGMLGGNFRRVAAAVWKA